MLDPKNLISEDVREYYYKGVMKEKWIGTYPNTLDELNSNKSLLYVAGCCTNEFGRGTFGDFACASYAKCIRLKMISETSSRFQVNNAAEWIPKTSEGFLDDTTVNIGMAWKGKSESDLAFA